MTTTVATTEPAGEPTHVKAADLQPGQWVSWPDSDAFAEILSVHAGRDSLMAVVRWRGVSDPAAARLLPTEILRLLTADEVKAAELAAGRVSMVGQLRAFADLLMEFELPVGGRHAYDVLPVMIGVKDAAEVDRIGELLGIAPAMDSARRYEVEWAPERAPEDPRLSVEWYVYLPKPAAEPETAPAAATVETDTTGFFFDQPDRLTDVESTPIAADVQAVALVGRPNGRAKR